MDKRILANGTEVDLTALNTLQDTISRALARVVALRQVATDGLRRLDELEAQGLDFATPIYQGDYLYRSALNDAGRRKREYIGTASEKVAGVLEKMNRGKHYTDQAAALRAIARQVALAQRPATRLVEYLEALKTQ